MNRIVQKCLKIGELFSTLELEPSRTIRNEAVYLPSSDGLEKLVVFKVKNDIDGGHFQKFLKTELGVNAIEVILPEIVKCIFIRVSADDAKILLSLGQGSGETNLWCKKFAEDGGKKCKIVELGIKEKQPDEYFGHCIVFKRSRS